jgi:oligoendopeptidase F
MNKFLDSIFPNVMAADQQLKEKLLASQVEPQGFEIPLRNMHAEADLFRASNLPLLAEQQKLAIQYDKIYGSQTVSWEGEEITLTRLAMIFQQPDRQRREKAWKLKAARQLADVRPINALWVKFMDVRARIAKNAGKLSYREYAWQQKLRFDYTPADCKSFASAIEQVVVPAATRVYEKRKKTLVSTPCVPGTWWMAGSAAPPHPPVCPFSNRSPPLTNSSRVSQPSSTGWIRYWVAISIPCWMRVLPTWQIAKTRPPARIALLTLPSANHSSSSTPSASTMT